MSNRNNAWRSLVWEGVYSILGAWMLAGLAFFLAWLR